MAIQLAEYEELLEGMSDPTRAAIEAAWKDAARIFSPRGLDAYVRACAGLEALGRGDDLVESFIESAPQVARELGEQAVSDLFSAAIKMYSKTSAGVLVLLFTTSPTAAARLGELELFRGYLALLDVLLSQVPRALRPMLEKLDVLLAHLTLGGLRRWATWGASAHRGDFDSQSRYFGLESEDSLAVMKKEQRGVLFVDVQRRLIMYLRALWGRDFFLRPTSGDFETREGYKPYVESYFIHLPDAFDNVGEISGLEIYRAAAAHAAAHIVYSSRDPDPESLNPMQRVLVGVIEDARVEALACRAFPGLKAIWLGLLASRTPEDERFGALLDGIARALLDESYRDTHPLVDAARRSFAAATNRMEDKTISREIGIELARLASDIPFNPRTDIASSPYRDDNRHLWAEPDEDEMFLLSGQRSQVRKYVSLMEMVNAVDVEFADENAEEIWVLPTELYDDDGVSLNEREGKEPAASPVHYREWDYQTQLERPNWATLLERRPKMGDPIKIDEVIEKHKPLVRKLKYLIEAIQPQGVIRQRKVEDGDDIDINAAIRAAVDLRMGMQPDTRIGIRTRLQIRDLSVLLLIDLSESTNDPVRNGDGEVKVLDLAREAAALLADALSKIGDPFAIHGFDSNGRHEVEYFRFKDFDGPYDEKVKARLAGMSGKLSTRMGAALRHAGSLLARRSSQRRLIFLLTDGEPADNDVRDPQYLRHDTKRAVEELARQGITTFCLSLDPHADEYVSRIFGFKNYMVLDHVSRLPEKLPTLYMSLTR